VTSFDERASTWDDDPAKVARARTVADAIRTIVPLDGTARLLEYGAGTGLLAEALRDAVGPITLADTSSGMRDVMRAKVESGALAGARIWDLDLETRPAPDERFDLVAILLTLHHIDDWTTVLGRFAEMLDDGGWLCIADLDREDGSFHGEGADVHHGFDRGELAGALAATGFTDVDVRDCGFVERHGGTFSMFLATCRRPSTPLASR
jgi:ubiquinone/menaquinone biosynthesis C-methylase UbiE